MRDHTKLRAFEQADEVALFVSKSTRSFPKEELYGLTSQIRRSAVSVPSNIVEGCGRNSQAETMRFLDIAYSSLKELRYQVDLSNRLGYFVDHDVKVLQSKIIETEKVLNALIRSLRKD